MSGSAHDEVARLNDAISPFERAAIGLAMTGRWTAEHDERLSALYEARRTASEVPRLSERQQDGFAGIVCGSEVEPQRLVGHGPRGQLFGSISHAKGTDDE